MQKAKGQMSIFFGIMIMIILSLTALVVNVGLFVKAKINLQNAVDAAAWSGAAVQSRQMTNIAYMNWEMRNVYKEWMFKYYVLGNIGLRKLNGPGTAPINGGVSNFTMNSFALNGNAPNPNADNRGKLDQYNIPSICVQFDSTTNDCDLYKLPPLPRFETSTQPGIAVTTDVFVDELSGIRSKGCADKSKVNFEVAAMWAYAVAGDDNDLSQNAPALLANRSGAFTKAFELGIRVRNLESLVNFPASRSGICASAADAAGSCGDNISALAAQDSPHLERTVKAFYSAYRNLGNDVDSEMKASFTLTELPPDSQTFATTSLSGMLYPGTNVQKQYIDLRLMPVNYATFYTAFVTPPSSSNSGLIDDGISSTANFTGGCDATKVALPVPGYPLGFVKNPDMVTHYAVKGEANFVGLFNPFSGDFTKLTAYAAAKPFGGRIGPALFNTQDNSILTARSSDNGSLSRHYSAAFALEDSVFYFFDEQGRVQEVNDDRSFVLGAPVPIFDFWVSDTTQAIGGDPTNSSANALIRFSIPNLVWSAEGSQSPPEPLMTISPGNDNLSEPIGLYNFEEYNRFKASLDQNTGTITPEMMDQAVINLRAPTDYEAYNYLIPSPSTVNADLGLDSFGQMAVEADGEGNYNGEIYAPLFEQRGSFPYNSAPSFRTAFTEYLIKQRTAVEMYLRTMKEVADSVRDAGNSSNFATNYEQAAAQFSDATDPDGVTGLTCDSIAGTFYYYYLGTAADGMANREGCPDPFSESFEQFWSGTNPEAVANVRSHRVERFNYFQDTDARLFFTGYAPGPRQGADRNAVVQHPVFSQQQNMSRNFYSTKFTSLRSVSRIGGQFTYSEQGGGMPIFSQGRKQRAPSEMRQSGGTQQNTIRNQRIPFDFNQYLK